MVAMMVSTRLGKENVLAADPIDWGILFVSLFCRRLEGNIKARALNDGGKTFAVIKPDK